MDLEYAGFWVRVGASLIDSILLIVVSAPLLTAIYGWSHWQNELFVAGPADFVITYVLPALITVVLWAKLAATPGKMAFGATIVDARTGGVPTTGQFVIRYIGYYVSAIGLLLGFIWAGFDPRKQGWHDKMAGTVVVRRKGGAAKPVQFEQKPAAVNE